MVYVILALVIGGIVFAILNRNNPEPPPVDAEEVLLKEGLTRTQARRELRSQRAEYRQAQRLRNNNIRVANSLAKTVVRLAKKKR